MNGRGLAALVLVLSFAAEACVATRGTCSADVDRDDPDRADVIIPQDPVLPPLPDGSPPLGLDGFCPVTLVKKFRWHRGDVGFRAIYEGRTYQLAGAKERDQFLAEPKRYAPVLSGDDAVLYCRKHERVAGRREHGVFYHGRVYLFRDEDSLSTFARDPSRYAEARKKPGKPRREGPGGP